MQANAIEGETKGDFYDCRSDFQVLPIGERRGILSTAKTLLREQNKIKSLLANAGNDLPPMEAKEQKRS